MTPETPVPAPSVVTPVEPTPTPQPIPTEQPAVSAGPKAPEEKGKMKWMYAAVIIMGLLALALVGFIAYTEIFEGEEDQSSQEDGDENPEDQDSPDGPDIEENEGETTIFAGDFVEAELPDGWTIVEYVDGDGTDMIVDEVPYVGLTALEVINPDDELVFKIKAVDGIGGVDQCDTYAQFPDYNVTHYNQAVSDSAEVGTTTTPETIASGDYTEFYFLGLLSRRVEDYIYIDEVSGNNYFEPPCGLLSGAWQIPDISYTTDGVENHSYIWEIEDTTPDEELLILDVILGSVVAQ